MHSNTFTNSYNEDTMQTGRPILISSRNKDKTGTVQDSKVTRELLDFSDRTEPTCLVFQFLPAGSGPFCV